MKKYLLVALLIGFFGQLSHAQDYRIGIKVGPTLSLSRTSSDGNSTDISRNGSSVKFLIGAFVDIPFKENYYFHGGLNFASKNTGISLADPSIFGGQATSFSYDHEFIQIPLLLKLYTNELILDTRVFFNFGVVPEIRLNTDLDVGAIQAVTDFQDFDLAGNFGGGVERSIGVNTRVYAGLNYYIGFLNQVAQHNTLYDEFQIKSNLFSLEIGVKF